MILAVKFCGVKGFDWNQVGPFLGRLYLCGTESLQSIVIKSNPTAQRIDPTSNFIDGLKVASLGEYVNWRKYKNPTELRINNGGKKKREGERKKSSRGERKRGGRRWREKKRGVRERGASCGAREEGLRKGGILII